MFVYNAMERNAMLLLSNILTWPRDVRLAMYGSHRWAFNVNLHLKLGAHVAHGVAAEAVKMLKWSKCSKFLRWVQNGIQVNGE